MVSHVHGIYPSVSIDHFLRLSGLSFTAWNNQHIVGHHIYTNVAGVDPDLPMDFKSDIRRILERQVVSLLHSEFFK